MDISSSINISKFVIFQVISINLQLIPQHPAAKWWLYPAPPPGRRRSRCAFWPCRATERRPALCAPLCAPAPAPRWLERGKGLRARPTFGRSWSGAMVDPKWSLSESISNTTQLHGHVMHVFLEVASVLGIVQRCKIKIFRDMDTGLWSV